MKKILIALSMVALLTTPVAAKKYGDVLYNVGCETVGQDVTPNYDLAKANCYIDTIDTGTTTITLSNPAPSGYLSNVSLVLTNAGAKPIIWANNIKWPAGVEPAWTETGVDWVECATVTGGTTWYCFGAGQDLKSP
jgi:hypothetical protein